MSDQNFPDRQLEAARVASEIEDSIDRALEKEEVELFAELSKMNAAWVVAKLNSLKFSERETRSIFEKTQKRNRARLMYCILRFVCNFDHALSLTLCGLTDDQPSSGGGMGMGMG
jgi:hypothetical protein